MTQTPFDLTGKVAIVTGSSRGIGRASAELLARMGAKVVVSSRTAEACEPVAAAIRTEGGDAIVLPCHIGRKAEVEALVSDTLAQFGRLDVLVCNAAVNPYYGPLEGLADEAFDKIMGSNIRSNLWLCNLAIPHMVAQAGDRRHDHDAAAALRGTATLGGYGISKAADFALARNLAVEWGHKNVRVNCVAPGLIKTDFARALWDDEAALAKREAETPLRRIGVPDEIAGTVAFLASSAASFITGQAIVADGGVTIA
jgi:NAD(P)-dependent dehydrogenase (short-subunit alcohol dehydrogenase family)